MLERENHSHKIGLISGEGEFPLLLAKELKKLNYYVVGITFSRTQEKKLQSMVDKVYHLYVGQLEKLIKTLKKEETKEIVFLGKIDKSLALRLNLPDKRALKLWQRVNNREDNTLLKALVDELEGEGFIVKGPAEFLKNFLVEEGIYTEREPTAREWEDIHYGIKIAKTIGELDIGQCVVVKDKMTVAVEAMEGTDATILRGGKLRPQAVVIKISKPHQDLRLDLPVAGLRTIETLVKAKASALALEANRTFFLQKEKAVELANKYKISIVGVR
ncbi:MAG: UDP-2,3-diacylglucosamine diphosphatase LpxI [Thermodesulfobacteriaceae bacterium]|nr:UDP-2,3-diacylglucosamine diphosphatase LpxI [Thermodesulfobacteriaceae bacterium]